MARRTFTITIMIFVCLTGNRKYAFVFDCRFSSRNHTKGEWFKKIAISYLYLV